MKSYSSKFRILLIVSLLSILCFWPLQGAFAATEDLLPFENLTADMGRGFGSNWNRYAWSMEEFNGDIYVGTWNTNPNYPALIGALLNGDIDLSGSGNILEGISFLQSQGGEIWRYDGQDWNQVLKAERVDTGFRKMVAYNCGLYAATANSEEGTNLFYSKTGDEGTWTALSGGPLDNPDNNSIRTLTVVGDTMYVGTENNATGGELWAFNGSNWTQIGAGSDFGGDASVAQVTPFGNRISRSTCLSARVMGRTDRDRSMTW